MNLRRSFLALLIFLPWASLAQSTDNLSAFTPSRAEYTASYNGLPISVVRELTVNEQGLLTLSSKAKNMLGKIEEVGTLNIDQNQRIQNIDYRYKRSILGSKKKERLHFDQNNALATYTSGNKTRQVPLDKPFHNRISYQLQLQHDLQRGCENLSYPVIARGKTKIYKFEYAGHETLETPLGIINTVKVKRVRKDSDRETALWFAPDLGYLLVKLWQQEDGEDYQINLKNGLINGITVSDILEQITGTDQP